MIDPGLLYLAVIGALLLVALGLGVRVLWDIVGDAREIRRRRRSGGLEPYTEDEEHDRVPRDPVEDDGDDGRASATCPQCGADNDPAFTYCVVGACRRSLPMSDRRRPPNRADASSVTSSYGQTTHY